MVGTASYKHTLMRVRTMSEKKLDQRIRTIERAKGQHAVIKMRLFARVLCLEGYEDLAAEATESLKRLVEVLGDPGSDEVQEVSEAAADGDEGEEADGGGDEEEGRDGQ